MKRSTHIVGREREQLQLRELLDHAVDGHGSLVLIGGEAGIGKTSLVSWLAEQALDLDMLVLSGSCHDLTTTPPYGPWREITNGYSADGEFPPLPEPLIAGEALDTVPSQGALFRLVASFFAEVAARRPLLLVLEDLHWSDLESPQLLRYLARELAHERVLLVATYRDDELTRRHQLFQLIPVFVRESGAARIDLRRWGTDEITELVENRYQLDEPDLRRLVNYLDEQTEGNPLFIQEMLNTLETEEILRFSADLWCLDDLDNTTVPPFVVQLIEGRLSRLAEPTRELVEVASVVGHEVSIDLLRRLSGADDVVLMTALSQAFDAHLFEETAVANVIRFRHALVREALYSGIMLLRRQLLHRQLADIMIDLANPDPDELVTHLERANDPRLVEWLVRSGDSAAARFAWETAVERFQRAVSLLELRGITDPEQLCEVLLKLGEAQNSAGTGRRQAPRAGQGPGPGNDPEAQSTFWKVVEIARDVGLLAYLGEAALGIAGNNVIALHGGPDGVRLTAEVLELLPDADSSLRARLLARLATGVINLGFHAPLVGFATAEEVDAWSTEAIAMARRLRDREILAYTLHCRNAVIGNYGHHEERHKNSAEIVALATQLRHLPLLADGLYGQIFDFSVAGDLDSAQETFERFVTVTKQLAMPIFDWRTAMHQSGLAISEGRYADARQNIDRCDAIWPLSGAGGAQKLRFSREVSDLQVMNEAPRLPFLPSSPQQAVAELSYFLESGQDEVAKRRFEAWIDDGEIFSELMQRSGAWLYVIAILAESCAALRDARRAQKLYDHLIPYDGLNIFARISLFSMGATAYHLGLLAATMEKWDHAADHFARALEQNDGWGFLPAAAYTRYEWARMLINRGNAADLDQARAMLDEALETARQIGMVRLERLATELANELSVADEEYPAGLTTREVEVLRLVAQGMTNAEVAEDLFISPRTVSQHLRSIFNKTGVSNRAAAAIWAAEHGLIPNRFGLTPRETDVLRLVAQGLTDVQIAEELFISPSTVMNHVSNILGKLQVSTRTAAAAVAVREGIV